MILTGNKELVGMYIGTTLVNKVALGTTPVYEVDYSKHYLTFDVISEGVALAIRFQTIGSESKTIYYSKDNGSTWTELTSGNTTSSNIPVRTGDKVLVKGNNATYATDKNNHTAFYFSNGAKYNVYGNIMSLVYGDNFLNLTTLTGTFNFCSLFKSSGVVSAKNLILPATTLTTDCYRAMFSKAYYVKEAPALPATTLGERCYWYMFEECPITTAPDLNAETLVKECYGHMFEGCAQLTYLKCMGISNTASNCTTDWLKSTSSEGTFVCRTDITWDGIPSGWTTVRV